MRLSLTAKSLLFMLTALLLGAAVPRAHALGEPHYVTYAASPRSFPLVDAGHAAPLLVSPADWPGVLRAAGDLRDDIHRVTGLTPALLTQPGSPHAPDAVLIGTIGHSPLIDSLVRRHKLDVSGIHGQWESAVTTFVDHPSPGIRRALVIAGVDKRGTIFAIYDLSEQIGVSPWYWWADVRVPHHDALFVAPGRHIQPVPAVKYRGIFLNDEAPALSGWVQEKFGGFNHKFYVHVFELLLRLKANYLWPAMWNSAFAEDDPLNPKLADEYGIVMGTSHEEPMMRAEKAWTHADLGPWNYATNSENIDQFWREGMERDRNYEEVVTLGMRGINDTPMSATDNISQLEKIIAKQREILKHTVNPDLSKIPQDWALYKEVQGYYERGMRVPDDVTLLWSDDNWGDLRRLPTPAEQKRSGGAGIYYHFDYVGGPRSYKWLNTYPIPKVWEQMNLALHYDATRIWVVNVGDLKPMEFPIEFFLTMARTPNAYDGQHLHQYTLDWATREFGPPHAEAIASAIEDYTRYNGRRKPELIDPTTFSLTSYDEAGRVDAEWRSLADRVDKLASQLPADERASYFELVQYPVDACANLTEMYIAAGRNQLYARQGRAEANAYAQQVRDLFAHDALLTDDYNHKLLNGKWDHMMDQTHIGYFYWNEPPLNIMPAVSEVQVPAAQVPAPGSLGVSASGGRFSFRPSLGTFDSVAQQTRTLTLFDRGSSPVSFHLTPSSSWITLSQTSGTITGAGDLPIAVHIDWTAAPAGVSAGRINITQREPQSSDDATGSTIGVTLSADKLSGITRTNAQGFVESDGLVAIEAADTAARSVDGDVHWVELPGYGATRSAMTIFPVTAPSNVSSTAALDYRVYLTAAGPMTLQTTLAPTQNFVSGRGLRFAVSVDGGPRTVVDSLAHNTPKDWAEAVSNGVRLVSVPLTFASPGYHTVHIWAVDPALVLERLVLYRPGALLPSYLGPPESFGPRNPDPVL